MEESNLSIKLGSRFLLHGSDASFIGQKIEEDFSALRAGAKQSEYQNKSKINKPY